MQGATGCAAIDWDNWLTSYLRQILLARVYELAVSHLMRDSPKHESCATNSNANVHGPVSLTRTSGGGHTEMIRIHAFL